MEQQGPYKYFHIVLCRQHCEISKITHLFGIDANWNTQGSAYKCTQKAFLWNFYNSQVNSSNLDGRNETKEMNEPANKIYVKQRAKHVVAFGAKFSMQLFVNKL